MSILLLGLAGDAGSVLVEHLVGESDDVRVVEADEAAAARWSELGAHVARGSPTDDDLVERAAHNARTIVVCSSRRDSSDELVFAALEAAARAPTGARLVVCSPDITQTTVERIRSSGLEHIILRLRSPGAGTGRLRDGRLSPRAVAEVVSAADDLSGAPRLYLDLGDAQSWARLGLAPPRSARLIRARGRRVR
jgi:uncharacterized protein YbjT (DUF2867 family)